MNIIRLSINILNPCQHTILNELVYHTCSEIIQHHKLFPRKQSDDKKTENCFLSRGKKPVAQVDKCCVDEPPGLIDRCHHVN